MASTDAAQADDGEMVHGGRGPVTQEDGAARDDGRRGIGSSSAGMMKRCGLAQRRLLDRKYW
jgi:hypothetical protein